MRHTLELVDVDSDRLEEVLRRAEQALDEKDAALIRAVFESYAYVTDLVEDKSTSIRRLRQLLFGSRTEKTESVVGPKTETPEAAGPRDAAADVDPAGDAGNADESAAAAAQGHGRQRRRGVPGRPADRRPAPVAPCGRRLSRLRRGDCLRQGPGRAGADHRAAAAGGDGVPAPEATLPPVRPGLHRGCARRGRPDEVRRHGRQHDRAVEVRQRTTVQPRRRPAGGPGRPAAGLDPVGHRGGGGREPRPRARRADPAGGSRGGAAQRRHDGQDPRTDGRTRPARGAGRRRGRCGRASGPVHLGRGRPARRPSGRAVLQRPPSCG